MSVAADLNLLIHAPTRESLFELAAIGAMLSGLGQIWLFDSW